MSHPAVTAESPAAPAAPGGPDGDTGRSLKQRLARRLLPLQLAVFLQGVALWVPVEKLFLTEIGFDAATIGIMAAAYAAVVPLTEVVSGIVADRWSRRSVLVVGGTALAVSVLIAGLSRDVLTYIAAAVILGVYFALYSGTVDAVVYDTVLEETGGSGDYEQQLGRVRVVESLAFVLSALAGGWIAGLAGTRLTYFLTLPFTVVSLLVLMRFREPRLHQAGEATGLRRHLATTYRAIIDRGRLVPIAAASVMTAMILQAVYEFGPLWLVAMSSSPVVYGPFWAALVATPGLGGLLAGRLRLDRRLPLVAVTAVMVLACVTMTSSRHLVPVTLAMVVLALLVVVAGIHVSHRLHDAVPSTIRTGVASGVSAASWLTFLPFALAFGALSKEFGVYRSGWMFTGAAVLAGGALLWVAARPVPAVAGVAAADR